MKKLEAIKNHVNGYDLMTERDSGNEVRILTGKYSNSLSFWKRLKLLADDVIYSLEEVEESYREESLKY